MITQNIDNLHQEAGSKVVHEYHGTAQFLLCLECAERVPVTSVSLSTLPPRCGCGGLYKPDFIFFGEAIPQTPAEASLVCANRCDVMLVIGTSGEVMPACALPYTASENGATVIEVNLDPSSYTKRVTDIYLEGKATELMSALLAAVAL